MSHGPSQACEPIAPHPIRVLLVHDHLLAIWALERLIESTRGEFVVVGRASDGNEALRLARDATTDLVLLCLDSAVVAGVVMKLVKPGRPHVVLLTTTTGDHAAIDRVLVRGARGLLRRGDSPETILKAMRKVHEGELWLDRATSARIFGLLTKGDVAPDPIAARIARLTVRERNIVVMIAGRGGARHREVAGMLGLSEHTLRNHLSKIYAKLELSGHFELYLYAKRHGLDRLAHG